MMDALKGRHRFLIVLLVMSLLFGCSFIEEDVEPQQELEESHYIEQLYENSQVWGLGKEITSYVSNDRPYEWYVDQETTGTHAGDNCGPSSVAMAAKWYDENSDITAEALRKKVRPLGGWWYGEDLASQLTELDIPHQWVTLEDRYTLMGVVDLGGIAIVNNTMGTIPYQSEDALRTGRFYSFDSGHFLIVKGYVIADGNLYFEVYDPNNWSMVYSDGTPKGKNRYYLADQLIQSIEVWYNEILVVPSAEK